MKQVIDKKFWGHAGLHWSQKATNIKTDDEVLAEYKMDMLRRAIKLCDCGYASKRHLLKKIKEDHNNPYIQLDKWPKKLSFHMEIDGVWFTLFPSGQQPGKLIRLYVHCPVCEKIVPAGRLHQHAKVHR